MEKCRFDIQWWCKEDSTWPSHYKQFSLGGCVVDGGRIWMMKNTAVNQIENVFHNANSKLGNSNHKSFENEEQRKKNHRKSFDTLKWLVLDDQNIRILFIFHFLASFRNSFTFVHWHFLSINSWWYFTWYIHNFWSKLNLAKI